MDTIRKAMWVGIVSANMAALSCAADTVVNIGGRRELFVDNAMVEQVSGGLRFALHHPQPQEIVFVTDKPWEGNASCYQSVMTVDGKYRMYYRGLHYDKNFGVPDTTRTRHPAVLCCAESEDGLHWTRPNLGICAFGGSKENNIVLDPSMVKQIGGDPGTTSVFYDENPACPADQRYKIVINGKGGGPLGTALYILGSEDGLHFRLLSATPCITDGAFDSQNLIFWDSVAKTYRAYYRYFRNGIRDILTAASADILKFPPGKQVKRQQGENFALYTNQMQPYYRAPHIILGFPMRYYDRGEESWKWPAMSDLPGLENRKVRSAKKNRLGTAVTDGVLLASRDGETVRFWEEAFMRPGPRQKESWVYGDNFIFWGLVETASRFKDAPREISFYSTEGYWEGDNTEIRRSTLRLDGFVSAQAPAAGGELVTRPLMFSGQTLSLNFATGGPGEIKVELQRADGTPVPGYTLSDCYPIFGDHIEYPVAWKGKGKDVSALAGTPVRIRFVLKDADIYAFHFAGK